jgi:hypothetical protein
MPLPTAGRACLSAFTRNASRRTIHPLVSLVHPGRPLLTPEGQNILKKFNGLKNTRASRVSPWYVSPGPNATISPQFLTALLPSPLLLFSSSKASRPASHLWAMTSTHDSRSDRRRSPQIGTTRFPNALIPSCQTTSALVVTLLLLAFHSTQRSGKAGLSSVGALSRWLLIHLHARIGDYRWPRGDCYHSSGCAMRAIKVKQAIIACRSPLSAPSIQHTPRPRKSGRGLLLAYVYDT